MGRSAQLESNNDKTRWTAWYTIPQNTTIAQGTADFSIVTVDLAGNISNPIVSTTDASGVTVYYTAPAETLNGDMDKADTNYIINVTITFDEGTAVINKYYYSTAKQPFIRKSDKQCRAVTAYR